MPGLDPGIHVFWWAGRRGWPGHARPRREMDELATWVPCPV